MKANQASPDVDQGHLTNLYDVSNLTRLQLLYWVGHKLRPGTPLFNTILTFTISGKVDRDCFEKAFHSLLEQCDALRTIIKEIDGVPQRKVVSDFSCELDYLDFSSEPNAEAALQAWLQKRCLVPLNLELCLFDTALIRTAPDRFVWYLNQDHIITDASSFFLIFQLLAKSYEFSLKGETLNMARMPIFENYAKYERKYHSSSQALRAQAYWNQKLTPGPEAISINGKVPTKKSTLVQRVTYDLGFERSQKLRVLANLDFFVVSEDLSLYNIFAALFFVLIQQMSNNHRLGFVTTVHNRFAKSFRDTVGLLLELCPLQVEISKDDSLTSLIGKVQSETRETLAYYQVGSKLNLQNSAFDVMFNSHKVPVLSLNGLRVTPKKIHFGHGSESFALHVNDDESSGRFSLHFDFHREIFTSVESERAIQTYVQLVDAFLDGDSRPIMSFEISIFGDVRAGSGAESNDQLGKSSQSLIGVERSREFLAPRDLIEHQLIQIWEEHFEFRPISVKDDFIELGGTSYLATHLCLKIINETGINLPLSILLEARTVEEMANIIRTGVEGNP